MKLDQSLAKLESIKAEKFADLSAVICNSIKLFLEDLKTNGTMKIPLERATKIIMNACSFKNKISSRGLKRILGFNRKRLRKHRKDYYYEIVDSDSESEYSDNDDDCSTVISLADNPMEESGSELADSDIEPDDFQSDEDICETDGILL